MHVRCAASGGGGAPPLNSQSVHAFFFVVRAPQAIVGANEGRGHYWGEKGDRFYRKTKGKSMMLSGFICPCHGRMEMSAAQVPAFEKFVTEKHPDIVFTGKSKFDDDGYGKGCAQQPLPPFAQGARMALLGGGVEGRGAVLVGLAGVHAGAGGEQRGHARVSLLGGHEEGRGAVLVGPVGAPLANFFPLLSRRQFR